MDYEVRCLGLVRKQYNSPVSFGSRPFLAQKVSKESGMASDAILNIKNVLRITHFIPKFFKQILFFCITLGFLVFCISQSFNKLSP